MTLGSILIFLCVFYTVGGSQTRPNVVVITAHGLTSASSANQQNTPRMSALSSLGVTLSQFYLATPAAFPSIAAILTGRHPYRFSVFNDGISEIPTQEVTVANILQATGYTTGFFSDQELNPSSAGCGNTKPVLLQGFDRVESGGDSLLNLVHFMHEAHAAVHPFLAMLWLDAPETETGSHLRRTGLERLNERVERVYDELRALNLEKNTIFIFSGATVTGPISRAIRGRDSRNSMQGSRGLLWNSGILVPAFIIWPSKLSANSTIHVVASQLDLLPTIVDLTSTRHTGDQLWGNRELDGISLKSILLGEKAARHKPIPFRYHSNQLVPGRTATLPYALIDYPYKLLTPLDYGTDRDYLFDLSKDHMELQDISRTQRNRVNQMKSYLHAWINSTHTSYLGQEYNDPSYDPELVWPDTDCERLGPQQCSQTMADQCLQKRAISSKERFVFIAGVGGTGHHLFQTLLQDCAVCTAPVWRTMLWRRSGLGLFTAHSQTALDRTIHSLQAAIRRSLSDSRSTSRTRIFAMNCLVNTYTGMLSYPNFFGQNLSHTPNALSLGQVMESMNADYRVVVLLRSPWPQLYSIQRRFANFNSSVVNAEDRWQYLARVFGNAQRKLISHLRGMDRAFYACVEYENMLTQIHKVDQLVLHGMQTTRFSFSRALKSVYKPSSYGVKPSASTQKWIDKYLRPSYEELRELCGYS